VACGGDGDGDCGGYGGVAAVVVLVVGAVYASQRHDESNDLKRRNIALGSTDPDIGAAVSFFGYDGNREDDIGS
jgi:hypothetical protein